MTIARTIRLGSGLIVLMGVGAATFAWARQAVEKSTPSAPKRSELRERVITLGVEADLLQLEYDGTRAALLKWLQDSGQADLMGIDISALVGTVKLELGGITGDAASLKEMSDLMTRLDADHPEAALKAVQEAAKKGKHDLRAAFERKRAGFTKTARLLHEKKLDLAEAQKQYQSEAR